MPLMSHPSQPERGSSKPSYFSHDTIAALASKTGGAVSLLRISGPIAFDGLAVLAGSDQLHRSSPRTLRRAHLQDSHGHSLDDALVACFPAPASYTGENVVELYLHGSSFIAHRILEILASIGIRQALPGEFSFRAVRNGKLTLSQAQAVSDLIQASNDGAIQLALEKMSGTQNRLIADLASGLRKIAVLGEVGIDFSDQDLDEVSLPALRAQLSPLYISLSRLVATFSRGIRLQEGIRAAFIGLPNSGKSSFFNALLGEERSIVSELAGTTRDIVREHLTLRGPAGAITLRLEDTAGLRSTQNRIERLGIERSQAAARDADLILFLVDCTAPLPPAVEQWHRLGTPTGKTIGVITKTDLISPGALEEFEKKRAIFGIQAWVKTSSITGAGISEAIDSITAHCARWVQREAGEVLLTRLDHKQAATQALLHLERAQQAPALDLFASDVRQALHALSPLIGDTLPDDILGQIFSEFCIGK